MENIFHDNPLKLSEFHRNLIEWYQKTHRKLPWRKTNDPYKIWVSEVMLQQTQVKTVLKYYRPFISRFPNIRILAEADQHTILKYWELLGYYARARNLHKAAWILVRDYNGNFPHEFNKMRELPGVGEYIASAICSIAFNNPHAVVDGNVKRVIARLLMLKAPVNEAKSHPAFKTRADQLLNREQPGQYNQAMMELGALICVPHVPKCEACPVKQYCNSFMKGTAQDLPIRIKKRKIPQYHISTGVIFKGNKILITQRQQNGLLGGLWEFPGGKVHKNESPEDACLREIKEEVNLQVKIRKYLSRIKHTYTHFKIIMDVYLCNYISGRVKINTAQDFQWIQIKDIERFPFPGANHKFIPLLKKIEGDIANVLLNSG